jgi:hypothetical protein
MRSIERRFSNLQNKQPKRSSLINFSSAIKAQKFNVEMIRRWFKKLVEKSDYEASDKRVIFKHLVALSWPEGYEKRA